MSLIETIGECKKLLKAGKLENEATVSQAIVLRCLQGLGWPIFDPHVVAPEYAMYGGRRVDFALLDDESCPLVLIEVKRSPDHTLKVKDEEQLLEYASECEVQLGVLTNGYEWKFFLPQDVNGKSEENCKYHLNLEQTSTKECTTVLTNYLSYEGVSSGESARNLRRDFGGPARKRLIRQSLPKALRRVLQMEDRDLIDGVASTVNSLCGYWPDDEVVESFVKKNLTWSMNRK